jgi:hypothetical protein
MLTSRLFWKALDRADYAVMVARLWLFDLICGPEPENPPRSERCGGIAPQQ